MILSQKVAEAKKKPVPCECGDDPFSVDFSRGMVGLFPASAGMILASTGPP